MAALPFFKMQGAGNDFIVIDNRNLNLTDQEIINLTPKICDRRFGVGSDGSLTLQPSRDPSLDYTMFYRNADGSDAGMCGNGARCLALFAQQAGLGTKLRFNVHQNIYEAWIEPEKHYVQVKFPMQTEVRQIELSEAHVFQVNTGTEHIILNVPLELFEKKEELIKKGRTLRRHTRFEPQGTNVNFIYVNSQNKIKLRTYERGVENLTLACGTGAIASGIACHWQGSREEGFHKVIIQTDGGLLDIEFRYDPINRSYSDIILGGKAQLVFEGEYPI